MFSPSGRHAQSPARSPARILIIDRDRLFAEALRHVLAANGFDVVAVEADPVIGEARARADGPDLVIMDADDGESIYEAAHRIASEPPHPRVVGLSAGTGRRRPDAWSRNGFDAVLTKSQPTTAFVAAIRTVLDGAVVLPSAPVADRSDEHADPSVRSLTTREREVLQLLAEGAGSAKIAERFGVTDNTARKHVQNLLTKLQVHSRLEAVTFGVRHGLVRVAGHTAGSLAPPESAN
jgi:two-component system nitrate/nitrite response regulator NarL